MCSLSMLHYDLTIAWWGSCTEMLSAVRDIEKCLNNKRAAISAKYTTLHPF